MVDNVCLNAVRGISDLVIAPGLINVDFADVRTIMTGMGRALMGTGYGTGDKRAIEAAQQAISSPLLEDVSINGATGILLNITGGPDLTLAEMNEACSLIAEAADPEANIIFGSVIDAHAGDQVRITVIATGFNAHAQEHPTQGAGPRPRRAAARGRWRCRCSRPRHGAGADDDDAAAAAAVDEPVGPDVEPRRRAAATRRAAPRSARRQRRDHQPRRVLLEHVRGSAGGDGRDPRDRAAERARVDAVGASGTSNGAARRPRNRFPSRGAPPARCSRRARPTSWASRSRSSTSRPTCAAACTRPSKLSAEVPRAAHATGARRPR